MELQLIRHIIGSIILVTYITGYIAVMAGKSASPNHYQSLHLFGIVGAILTL